MVREVVEVVITEKGAAATSKKVKGIGSSARTAAKAVTALVVALGAIAAVRGFARLTSDAIKVASAFETYEVQLRSLLGSQEEANKALETFTDLSAKTPFAVSQIVEGSTALAASALGNRKKLEELTQTAANLAAVTGLSFQESASNLARSLQAGIGAADLFRERGVRALIQEIKGIPDATKLTADELENAFRDVFGAGGVFGEAAESLSFTLGGALSNIGDAATNFKAEFGAALSPTIINTARQVFIPFFQNLQAQVNANAEDINDFAADAISGLVQGFVTAARAGLALAQAFSQIKAFGRDAIGALLEIRLATEEFRLSARTFAGGLFATDEAIAQQEATVAAARASVDSYAATAGAASVETEKFNAALDGINEGLSTLERLTSGANLSAAIPEITGGPSTEDLTGGSGGAGAALGVPTKPEIAAAKELADLTRASRLRNLDSTERALVLIDEQILRAEELGRLLGDEAAAEDAINQLLLQRQQIVDGDEANQGFGEAFGNQIRQAFNQNIDQALGGDAQGAIQGFAGNLSDQLKDQGTVGLKDSLVDLAKVVEEPFKEAFDGVAGSLEETFGPAFEGLGEAAGEAIGAGLQFAAGLALEAISGTNSSQRSSVAGVSSAVTSSQALRGVVAGPQSIAIANVGGQIGDSVAPLIDLTTITNALLSQIRDSIDGQPLGGATVDSALSAAAFSSGATQVGSR